MAKPTNTPKVVASSIEAKTALSFAHALGSSATKMAFPPYVEAVTLFNQGVKAEKVSKERQEEWEKLLKAPIPSAPHTSTSLFCLLAAKWGGKVLPAKAADLTRLGRKGEQSEQIRLLLIQYFPIVGMVDLVKTEGFNANFYQAVLKYHSGEEGVVEWERLKSLLSLTSFNSSAVSQAAKAEGHLLFFQGDQVEIPTAEKGAKAEAKEKESKDLSDF
jgi:hypothetical protein